MQDARCKMVDERCKMQDGRCKMVDVRCKIIEINKSKDELVVLQATKILMFIQILIIAD